MAAPYPNGRPGAISSDASASTPDPSTPAAKPRSHKPTSEGRFEWISHAAMDRILRELGQGQAPYGIAVYLALARICSRDERRSSAAATVAQIAAGCGIGYRKTLAVLHDLARAKLILIQPGSRVAGATTQPPNSYTLLAARLLKGKPGRLHKGKSAGCMRRRSSYAEMQINSPPNGGESVNSTDAHTADTATADASQSAVVLSVERRFAAS